MPIVCGTDFSEQATKAANIAALLADHWHETLTLVHVADMLGSELMDARGSELEPERERLLQQARSLRAHDRQVGVELWTGAPHVLLSVAAAAAGAQLILVGADERLGRVAERTARESPVPVLVIKEATALRRWLTAGGRLRVMIVLDSSTTSVAAIRSVMPILALGECDVLLVRAGRGAPNARALSAAIRELGFGGGEAMRVCATATARWRELLAIVLRERIDLLVLPSRNQQGLIGWLRGAGRRRVLRRSPVSVACVPVHPG